MASALPKTVRSLGWVSFWADVASESVYPVIPLFVIGVLKAPMQVLGLTEGAAGALAMILRAWSGWHSDRTGKRMPYVRIGYGMSGLAKPMIGLAFAWPVVLFARLFDRFGKGLRTSARDAIIADAVDPSESGRAFGFHRAMDSAGAFVGASIGFLMLWLLPGQYRLIFLLAGIPGLIALGLTFRVSDRATPTPTTSAKVPFVWSKDLIRTLIPVTLFAIANSSDLFVLQFAKGRGFTDASVALAYILYNAVYASLSYPLGKLSDRIGRSKLMAAGWLVYSIVYFVLPSSPTLWIWGLMALYGFYIAATDGVSKALVADVAPRNARGTTLGVYYAITGVGALIASLAGGWLWDRFGSAATFQFGGAVALIALASLPILPRLTRTKAT